MLSCTHVDADKSSLTLVTFISPHSASCKVQRALQKWVSPFDTLKIFHHNFKLLSRTDMFSNTLIFYAIIMEHLTSMKLDPSENVILEPLGLWNSIVTRAISRAVNLIWLSSVSAASPRLSDTVMSIGQIAENVIPMKVKAFPVYLPTTKISIKTLFSIYINMAPWIQICSC